MSEVKSNGRVKYDVCVRDQHANTGGAIDGYIRASLEGEARMLFNTLKEIQNTSSLYGTFFINT